MTTYLAPTKEIDFTINELADMSTIARFACFEDASPDLVEAVLEEAGKLASEVLAPLNKTGDQQGSHLVDGKVQVPDGFAGAYQQYIESGWMGISQNPEYGGQGLPHLVHTAVSEMGNRRSNRFITAECCDACLTDFPVSGKDILLQGMHHIFRTRRHRHQ